MEILKLSHIDLGISRKLDLFAKMIGETVSLVSLALSQSEIFFLGRSTSRSSWSSFEPKKL